MKKFVISILSIMLAVGMVGGALAAFSDTETSSGNSFTAGTLDLTYNVSQTLTSPGGGATVSVTGAGDGVDSNGIDSQVAFGNLAPGDSGTLTWTLTNLGTLDGTLMVRATRSNDVDNVNTEPELLVDTDLTKGELGDNIITTGSYSLDSAPPYNFWGSFPLSGVPTTGMTMDTFPKTLPAGSVLTILCNWSIDSGVGNIIQGDTVTLNLNMTLDQ